jgi:hypothetical protein
MQYFAVVTLNGLTLAALYFLAASGFTLIFGLMRTVNMAHGGLLLLGAYLGYEITTASGSWIVGLIGSAIGTAAVGALIQACLLGRYQGEELWQTLLTIALSIILADLMLAYWGGITYQIEMPALISGSVFLPVLNIGYAAVRIFVMLLATGQSHRLPIMAIACEEQPAKILKLALLWRDQFVTATCFHIRNNLGRNRTRFGRTHVTVMANVFAETPPFMYESNSENDAASWIFITPTTSRPHGFHEKARQRQQRIRPCGGLSLTNSVTGSIIGFTR